MVKKILVAPLLIVFFITYLFFGGTQNSSLTHDDIVSRLKPLGKIENEIRGGSGLSMLEPRSAREAALEWLNGKAERKD